MTPTPDATPINSTTLLTGQPQAEAIAELLPLAGPFVRQPSSVVAYALPFPSLINTSVPPS